MNWFLYDRDLHHEGVKKRIRKWPFLGIFHTFKKKNLISKTKQGNFVFDVFIVEKKNELYNDIM